MPSDAHPSADAPAIAGDLTSVFFRPVRWQSAFEETVDRLGQAIKLGAVEVGEQLPSERELVAQLRISRTTLREAIRALQQEGILVTRRGRAGGTFVASDGIRVLSKSDARRIVQQLGPALFDLIDIRSAVEPKAAELAAQRRDPHLVATLQALLSRSHQAPVTVLRRTDSLLHIGIAQMASSELLMDAVLKVQTRLHDLLAFLSVVPTPKVAARHESRQHETILEAIARGDSQGARDSMAKHVEATEELLYSVLKISPSRVGAPSVRRRAARSS